MMAIDHLFSLRRESGGGRRNTKNLIYFLHFPTPHAQSSDENFPLKTTTKKVPKFDSPHPKKFTKFERHNLKNPHHHGDANNNKQFSENVPAKF